MPFDERIFWVYPWDLTDASPGERLKEIASLGANTISIPFAYHSVRALAPHRRGRKVFNVPAALGFRPRPGEFLSSGIQPPHADWADDEGPIPQLAAHAARSGLRVKAWTVVFHSSPLASTNPDSVIVNCFGESFSHALCPAAPKSRDYALRLVRAVAARPVQAIELEAVGFYGYEHLSLHDKCGVAFDLFHHFLFSCCFCPHCGRAFASAGLDTDEIARKCRQQLVGFFSGEAPAVRTAGEARQELTRVLGTDEAATLLRVRNECVLSLLREVRGLVPREIRLDVSSGLSPFECSALFGAEPQSTLESADRLLLVVFESGEAAFRGRFETALGLETDPSRWIAGVRIFPPDAQCAGGIESRLAFLAAKGFRAIQLYHYGLAPTHLLNAAAHALEKMHARG